jgi:hypothetical protein
MKKKGILSGKFHFAAIVLAGVWVIFLLLATGCSKSVPECDDGKTIKAAIDAVSQSFKNDLAAIAGAGTPGMELTDDEWKLLRSSMVIDLENPKELSFEAEKRICAATLIIHSGGKKENIPITYIPEIKKDSGELQVTISGLEEFKQSQPAPEPTEQQ